MIRFQEIWDGYQQGRIQEEIPMKAGGGSGSIDQAIDAIISYNHSDHVQQLEEASPASLATKRLDEICGEIQKVEERAKAVASAGPHTSLQGHIVRVIKAGDSLDTYILDSFQESFNQFTETHDRLQDSATVAESKRYRDKTDEKFGEVMRYFGRMEIRSLEDSVSSSERKIIGSYAKNQKIVACLQQDIDRVQQQMGDVADEIDQKKVLKKLKGSISGSRFYGATLVRRCYKAGYAEGIAAVEQIRQQIDFALDNYDDPIIHPKTEMELQSPDYSKTANKNHHTPHYAKNNLPGFKEIEDILGGTRQHGRGIEQIERINAIFKNNIAQGNYLSTKDDILYLDQLISTIKQKYNMHRIPVPILKFRLILADLVSNATKYVETNRALYYSATAQ